MLQSSSLSVIVILNNYLVRASSESISLMHSYRINTKVPYPNCKVMWFTSNHLYFNSEPHLTLSGFIRFIEYWREYSNVTNWCLLLLSLFHFFYDHQNATCLGWLLHIWYCTRWLTIITFQILGLTLLSLLIRFVDSHLSLVLMNFMSITVFVHFFILCYRTVIVLNVFEVFSCI